MKTNFLTRVHRKLWTSLLGDKSWIAKNGDFRDKEQYGLYVRPNYLYGMLRAADTARYFGKKKVIAVEFGVASGNGLLNMVDLAALITNETGVEFRIVGFDTGHGLPSIQGYKDHPEIWSPGDFTTADRERLAQRLGGRAEIIWGDIAETIDPFSELIESDAPLGFVSIDVDIYSATKSALRCLTKQPDMYLPAISMYFDDVGFFFANEWAGELAAISEFNHSHEFRKIGRDRSLPGHRPVAAEGWYSNMYVCHILDHDARQKLRDRKELAIEAHADFMKSQFLF